MAVAGIAATATVAAPQKAESDSNIRRLSSTATPMSYASAQATPPSTTKYGKFMSLLFQFYCSTTCSSAQETPILLALRHIRGSEGRRRRVSGGESHEDAIPASKVMPNTGGPGYQAQSQMMTQGPRGRCYRQLLQSRRHGAWWGWWKSCFARLPNATHALLEQQNKKRTKPIIDWPSKSLTEKVARLIELQTFDGSWTGGEDINKGFWDSAVGWSGSRVWRWRFGLRFW